MYDSIKLPSLKQISFRNCLENICKNMLIKSDKKKEMKEAFDIAISNNI